MKRKTTTGRSIELLEGLGWTAGIVERRITPTVVRDLFEIFDVVALKPSDESPTLGLQVTSASSKSRSGNVAERVKKLLAEEKTKTALRSGWRVEIWGMRDKPARDGSLVLARTLILLGDGKVGVVNGSQVIDGC